MNNHNDFTETELILIDNIVDILINMKSTITTLEIENWITYSIKDDKTLNAFKTKLKLILPHVRGFKQLSENDIKYKEVPDILKLLRGSE